MNPFSQKPFAQRERGFALLITITLLAFLVLLLVSLATLTRVETQVAGNNQQLAQARQNALLALNIAIGQLQKFTGPDQRTTARADLQNAPGQTNAMWTGAYGSSVIADYSAAPNTVSAQLTNSSNVNTYGSSARLLNWLVSGNENTAFDPSWGTGSVGTNGQITSYADPASTTAIRFKPAGEITGLTPATLATNTSLKINQADGSAEDARLLVGGNSVTPSLDASGKPIDYVVAPAIKIKLPRAQIPGFGTTGADVTVGRYAWWVGDEGVKARLNLPLAGTNPAHDANEKLAEKRRAFSSSPRAAIELMAKDTTGWSITPSALNAARIDTLYKLEDGKAQPAADIVSTSQASMASDNPTALATALKYRFHDVSTQSFSVLSDTYAGGLKKDLTRIIGPSSSPANNATLWPAAGDTTFVPTWGHLRSYYSQTSVNDVIKPHLPSSNNGGTGEVGVSPVITYAAMGFRYSSAAAPATDVNINLNIFPIVVLWNPYTSTMAGQDYEVGIGHMGSNARMKLEVKTSESPEKWAVKEIRDLRYAGKLVTTENSGTGQPMEYFRFKVSCGPLAPGESRVFTLDQSGQFYAAGQNVLKEGLYQERHVIMSDSKFLASEVTADFRFAPTAGSTLRYNVNGEVAVYLGDGTIAPPVTSSGSWDPTLNSWYQSIQRIDYAAIAPPSYTNFSDAEPLRELNPIDDPAFKLAILNTFSAIGKSYTVNNSFGASVPRYRWIAQANVRAPTMFRSRFDPSFVVPYYAKAGIMANLWPTWYLLNPSAPDRASSGLGLDFDIGTGTTANKTIDATLFELRDANQTLQSIGQLQHANLSLAGSYPAYPIGNSIADFRLRNTVSIDEIGEINTSNQPAAKQQHYYDISWLLNRTLWDNYFFSTVPTSGSVPHPLPNPRIVRADQVADNALQADASAPAAHLMIAGGFNINSTSEQAWRAVLGGVNNLTYDPLNPSDTSASRLGVTLSRFSRFVGPDVGTASPTGVIQDASYNSGESQFAYYKGDDMKSIWRGYRVLDANQIAQLARNIVAEIRTRGPFISLGDFINRRLIDNSAFVDSVNPPYPVKTSLTAEQKARFITTLKGTIQAAIDATTQTTASTYATNDGKATSFWQTTRTVSDLPPGTLTYYSLPSARGDINPGTGASDKTPQRNTSAFAPKFLTQADVLSNIGATLSARSDTFVIRTYGETVDPTATNPEADTSIVSRAWCEAVVQRVPDYVASGSAAGANAATDAPSALSDINKKFGRQFKIVSFRWLTANDI